MVNNCDDIDDIEDCVKINDLRPNERYENKKNVLMRGKSQKHQKKADDEDVKVNELHQSVSFVMI